MKERQREGITRAKAEGAYSGGKRRIDRKCVLALKELGKGHSAIASELGMLKNAGISDPERRSQTPVTKCRLYVCWCWRIGHFSFIRTIHSFYACVETNPNIVEAISYNIHLCLAL